ncbi:MAG: hypothetical protein KJ601_00325 [Nanoarchaeota archaeon]|nr:hypothetical protein [Nanoarchaeota archaeon]
MGLNEIIESLNLVRDIVKYVVMPDMPAKAEEGELEKKLSGVKADTSEIVNEVLVSIVRNKSTEFKLEFTRKKEQDNDVVIKYHETDSEQRLEIKDRDKKYSVDITKKKSVVEDKPYELNILYESKACEEKWSINYKLRDYPSERDESLQDFTGKADKTLHIIPKNLMGGVLGFTYLGENFMARRDDLFGDKALMVDVHEAIHTPDEYETRVLTDWMLAKQPMRYKK